MNIAKVLLYNNYTVPGDLKLDTICTRLGIKLIHHNAESDILCTKKAMEILLTDNNAVLENFIENVSGFRKNTSIIENNVWYGSVSSYWDDIKLGKTPVYFTNWKNIDVNFTPQYDNIELECLVVPSMMNRENCEIERIIKQINTIKSFIDHIGGHIYGKGAKKAKCYIEYYYTDVQEYIKLKLDGYKIYHAIDVVNYIENNQTEIDRYIQDKLEIERQQKNEIAQKKEEQRLKEEQQRVMYQNKTNKSTICKTTDRKLIQMDDDGNIVNIFNSLSDAIKNTGINSKSIRDCCNGIQKHAGGFKWEYRDEVKQ